jgi:hypothetical protein
MHYVARRNTLVFVYFAYMLIYISNACACAFTGIVYHCTTVCPLGQSPTPSDSAFEDETSKSETANATANVTASTTASTTADTTTQQLRRISNVNDSSGSGSSMQHTGYLILLCPVLLDCLVTRSRPVR